jgi:hypothetical protein
MSNGIELDREKPIQRERYIDTLEDTNIEFGKKKNEKSKTLRDSEGCKEKHEN